MNLFLIILLVAACFEPHRNLECVCIEDPSLSAAEVRTQRRKALDKAIAVFEGKVIALDSYHVTIKLQKRWKGQAQDEITLSTGSVPGYDGSPLPKECSYPFQLNQEYLVFAYSDGDKLEANICLTFRMNEAVKEETVLDQIRTHETVGAKSSEPGIF